MKNNSKTTKVSKPAKKVVKVVPKKTTTPSKTKTKPQTKKTAPKKVNKPVKTVKPVKKQTKSKTKTKKTNVTKNNSHVFKNNQSAVKDEGYTPFKSKKLVDKKNKSNQVLLEQKVQKRGRKPTVRKLILNKLTASARNGGYIKSTILEANVKLHEISDFEINELIERFAKKAKTEEKIPKSLLSPGSSKWNNIKCMLLFDIPVIKGYNIKRIFRGVEDHDRNEIWRQLPGGRGAF